jgi:hypothetical protein
VYEALSYLDAQMGVTNKVPLKDLEGAVPSLAGDREVHAALSY